MLASQQNMGQLMLSLANELANEKQQEVRRRVVVAAAACVFCWMSPCVHAPKLSKASPDMIWPSAAAQAH